MSTNADPLQVVIHLGECLSWALPMPYGALAAGAFTVWDDLHGAGEDSNGDLVKAVVDATQDAINQAVTDIVDFVEQSDLKDKTDRLIDFQAWFTQQSDVLAAIGNDAAYMKSEITPTLDELASPLAGTVFSVRTDVETDFSTGSATDLPSYDLQAQRLGLLIKAEVFLVFLLRMRLIMYAKLTTIYESTAADQDALDAAGTWLGCWATLVSEVYGLPDPSNPNGSGKQTKPTPDRLAAYVNELHAQLLMIGFPKNVSPWGVIVGTTIITADTWFEYSTDPWPSAHVATYADAVDQGKKWESDGWLLTPGWFYETDPAIRNNWYDDCALDLFCLGKESWLRALPHLDETRNQAISQLQDAGTLWQSHQPPAMPDDAKVVFESWTGSTPDGTNWMSGNAVAYAIVFRNTSGRSNMSDFCDWIEITTGSLPKLALPADPLKLTSSVLVYRKFRSQGTSGSLIKLVTGDLTTFTDTAT